MRGKSHAWYVGASLTYSYSGQDGKMEENGDTEEKRDEVKRGERQKCTRDIFVHHVHRQWVTWCLWCHLCKKICWDTTTSILLLFDPCSVLYSQQPHSLIISSGLISIWAIAKSSKCTHRFMSHNVSDFLCVAWRVTKSNWCQWHLVAS